MTLDTIVGSIWFLAAAMWTFAAYTWLKANNTLMYLVTTVFAAVDFVVGMAYVLP